MFTLVSNNKQSCTSNTLPRYCCLKSGSCFLYWCCIHTLWGALIGYCYQFLPDTLCRLESASPLLVLELLGELLSTPPSRGRRWLTDTCSMKEVPYFLKYHHSNIWEREKEKGGERIFNLINLWQHGRLFHFSSKCNMSCFSFAHTFLKLASPLIHSYKGNLSLLNTEVVHLKHPANQIFHIKQDVHKDNYWLRYLRKTPCQLNNLTVVLS